MKNKHFISFAVFLFCMLAFNAKAQNLMSGWDGNGTTGTGSEPSNFGWNATQGTETSEPVFAEATTGTVYDKIYYRDYNGSRYLIFGRSWILSHPVTLTTMKAYNLSATFSFFDGDVTGNVIVNIADAEGNVLYTTTVTGVGHVASAQKTVSLDFYTPAAGTYNLSYTNPASGKRLAVRDISIVETGNALEVSFNTDGGSAVSSQYFKEGETYTVNEPTAPTKDGFVFEGWYTDNTFATLFTFPAAVSASTTVYAKWVNPKAALNALIATVSTPLSGSQLETVLADANTVAADDEATEQNINDVLDALTSAITQYDNADLSVLTVGGTAIADFAADKYEYTYIIAPGSTPPAIAGSAAYEYATVDVNGNTITVTADNGETQDYVVIFAENLLYGWDGNGAAGTGSEPNNFGWSGASVYGTTEGNQYSTFMYRDYNNSRWTISGLKDETFKYTVSLEAGKTYQASAKFAFFDDKINGMIPFFAADAEGNILASTGVSVSHVNGGSTDAAFTFAAPTSGTYYISYINSSIVSGDQRLAVTSFLLTKLGDAIKVTFDSNGGSAVDTQYLLEGGTAIAPSPAPTKAKYDFVGWYIAPDLSGTSFDFNTPISSDITLYAKWDKGTDMDFTIGNDAVISTEYFTLQGQKVKRPIESSFYLVKKTFESGRSLVKKMYVLVP